jgi:hypothetical protein
LNLPNSNNKENIIFLIPQNEVGSEKVRDVLKGTQLGISRVTTTWLQVYYFIPLTIKQNGMDVIKDIQKPNNNPPRRFYWLM